MLLDNIELVSGTSKGKMLITQSIIPKGTVVWTPCDQCQVYTLKQLSRFSKNELFWVDELGYHLVDKEILLPCSNAKYMNHACEANVLDFGLDFGIAVSDILPGQEICCDYRTWVHDAEWVVECHCGSDTCLKKISPSMGKDKTVQAIWAKQVVLALRNLTIIEQPLHEVLLKCSATYKEVLKGDFKYISGDNRSVHNPLIRKYTIQ